MLGMGGLIHIERKGCELIVHDHDLWVTIVLWVDVQDSDRDGFRRRRAVDISGFKSVYFQQFTLYNYIHSLVFLANGGYMIYTPYSPLQMGRLNNWL